ncbi:IS110 family transposase [Micromonospora chalcea]|uniref:IS110 family transposase n=1 Tax=Micromonospora chalcea TaxID=1874 RepID=UPI003D76285D
MSMLADLVEVVIGVDTHTATHTAALLDTRTGGVLARATVSADPDGYAELVTLADEHSGLRAWALEGSGGYGAGLAHHLADAGELVVELDRPQRPTRRAGAKSDPIDAERAARDALARTRLAQPKTGSERAALQMRLTARRAAVEASATTQRQLHAMVITAPEMVRARFRGQSTRLMLTTATRLRPTTNADVDVFTSLTVLRDLARRVRFLEAEATEHEKAIRTIVRSWRPDLLQLTGVGPIVAATILTAWPHPGRCRNDAAFAMLAGAAPHSRLLRQDRPLPPQPLRRPPTQPRPAHHRPDPPTTRRGHPRLCRAPPNSGQNRPRDQTLPQTLRRPRPLSTPRKPTPTTWRGIGASTWSGASRSVSALGYAAGVARCRIAPPTGPRGSV